MNFMPSPITLKPETRLALDEIRGSDVPSAVYGLEPAKAEGACMVDGVHAADIVPAGIICMWSGALANIPAGWQLCDGTNGTPDLRDRFVMGAPDGVEPGGTGGAATATLAVPNLPAHTHSVNIDPAGSHTHTGSANSSGAHYHTYQRPYYTDDYASWSGQCYVPGLVATATSTDGAHTHSLSVGSGGTHQHTASIGSIGSGTSFSIVPPYFQIAFIMKL